MSLLLNKMNLANRVQAEREMTDGAQHDEVWDEEYVMSPLPNNEHLTISAELWLVFRTILGSAETGIAYNGLNVSDCEAGWERNYREPDVAVILEPARAKDCGTHWCGGPDLVVEILSPNDRAREKLGFYAALGVRETLIIDRHPWALELYRLDEGELKLVGFSTPAQSDVLTSSVLPVTFRMVAASKRPAVEIANCDRSQTWLV